MLTLQLVPAAGAIVLLAAGAAHAGRTTASLAGFPMAPPAAHTGGFGEPTCAACHMDHPLNDAGGGVELRGLPVDGWKPGQRYALTVVIRRPGMLRGGFQASARFAHAPRAGEQAGVWRPIDERVATTSLSRASYVHHSEAGTDWAPDSASWSIEWTAPESRELPVAFHVSALASDGDGSQFGDRVYTLELVARPR